MRTTHQRPTSMNSPPQRGKSVEAMKKAHRAIRRSKSVVYRLSSFWPFDFFPDDIIIDENKVNIIARDFIYSEDIHSVMISSIKDVFLESSPFFAKLIIVPDGYPGKSLSVSYLKKKEAMRAQRIIQGLMACEKEKVDMTALEREDEIRHIVEDAGDLAFPS